MKKYKTRKGGATVTIMVPYDCGNNCPFCVNKAEYENTSDFSLEKIIENIKVMDEITPYCDFVLTGGEPLADLEQCQQLLDAIPNTHKVFINTTLPLIGIKEDSGISEEIDYYKEWRLAEFLNRNANKITGINVSRHLYNFVKECNDIIFEWIKLPFRINCVLYGRFGVKQIQNYVKRFKKYSTHIQFRKDYTITTPGNLYDPEDEIMLNLHEAFEYVEPPLGEYRMRNGYKFRDEDGFIVTYHRTLPYSTIKEDGYDILYDIIIRQTGELTSDWNEYGVPLDVEAYKNVEFEDYK